MAEVSSQDIGALVAELRNLTRTMSKDGNMGFGSDLYDSTRKTADAMDKTARQFAQHQMALKRQEKAYKQSTDGILGAVHAMKRLKEGTNSYADMTDLARRQMEDMFKSLDPGELEDAAKMYRKTLLSSSNEYVRAMGQSVTSAEEMMRVQSRLSGDFLDDMDRARKLRNQGVEGMVKATNILQKHGMQVDETFSELDRTNEELIEANEELAIATSKTTEAMRNNVAEANFDFKNLGNALSKLTGVALIAGKALMDTYKSAAKTGTQMEHINAALMGMNPEELNQLQKEHIQIIRASGMTFDQFNEIGKQGASQLLAFTGEMKDGARIFAQAAGMAQTLGGNMEEFTARQQKTFEELNKTLSVTAEEFLEFNSRLMDSEAVQSQLYRINTQQRAAHIEDLQSTYRMVRAQGLLHEEALKVIETFEAIGAKSPRERMKEAAKLQAVMGGMGMGAQGARAAGLLRGGLREPGQKQEFAALMKEANVTIGERMGQGFAQEMMTAQMIETAGIGQYLGPGSEFSKFNTRQLNAFEQEAEFRKGRITADEDRNDYLKQMLKLWQFMESAIFSPMGAAIGAIAGAIGVLGGAKLGGSLLRTLSGFGAGAGAAAGGGATAGGLAGGLIGAGKNALRVGGIAAGTAGAATAAAYGTYQAGQAAVTGRSDVHDLLTSIEFGQMISDTVGATLHGDFVEALSTQFSYFGDQFGKFGDWLFEGEQSSEEQLKLLKENNEIQKTIRDQTKEQNEKLLEKSQQLVDETKKGTSAINQQTEEQKKQAEEKEKTDRGYRLQWIRMPRTAG